MGGFAFLGEVGRRKSSMLQNGGNHEKNCAEIVPYVWRAKSSSGDSMLCENDGKMKLLPHTLVVSLSPRTFMKNSNCYPMEKVKRRASSSVAYYASSSRSISFLDLDQWASLASLLAQSSSASGTSGRQTDLVDMTDDEIMKMWREA
jgi:hypothetical protein